MPPGSQENVLVDACCLINLYAAGDFCALARALRHVLWAPAIVADEASYILRPDDKDPGALVKQRIDLAPALQAGVIRSCGPEGEEETELFVQLATQLGDGEAMCLALAKRRSWAVATDDRKGRRIASELGLGLLSTPELMHEWATMVRADQRAVALALRNIQTFARYVPRPDLPSSPWWLEQLGA